MFDERYQQLLKYFTHALDMFFKDSDNSEHWQGKGQLKRLGVGYDQSLYAYLDFADDPQEERYRDQVYLGELLLENDSLDEEEIEELMDSFHSLYFITQHLEEEIDHESLFSVESHLSFRCFNPYLFSQLAIDLKKTFKFPKEVELSSEFDTYSFMDVQSFYRPDEIRSLKDDIGRDSCIEDDLKESLPLKLIETFSKHHTGPIAKKIIKAINQHENVIGKTYDDVYKGII